MLPLPGHVDGTAKTEVHPPGEPPTGQQDRLSLLVFYGVSKGSDRRADHFPLPQEGAVILGRSHQCDVRLDDPSISRQHARLQLSPCLTLTDLGSANGTRLRSASLHAGQPAALSCGEAMELGRLLIVVQRATPEVALEPGGAVLRTAPRLEEAVTRIAQSNISVLILGETGVGKEVMAEHIHALSPRAQKRLLCLHCAALSETLLESELFGHERGAFTGAAQAKPGLLESAEGGTVFLDEVGEIPLSTQIKLLRFLEERKVTRVGGREPRDVNVRILAATNRDLRQEIVQGRFRQDLYFRLNGFSLVIPPLRQRRDEIAGLAGQLLLRASQGSGRPLPQLTPAAMQRLLTYAWPGNIRELRNVIDRAVVLCPEEQIGPEHLYFEGWQEAEGAAVRVHAAPLPPPREGVLREELADRERGAILEALERTGGNQSRAAQLLGMPRRTLLKRLDDYGVPRPRK